METTPQWSVSLNTSSGTPPHRKRVPSLSTLLPDLVFSQTKMHYYGFWTVMNVLFLILLCGAMYSFQDTDSYSDWLWFVGYGVATILVLNVIFNFCMFWKNHSLYTQISEEVAELKLSRQPPAVQPVEKTRPPSYNYTLRRRKYGLYNNRNENFNEEDLIPIGIGLRKQESSYPWESVITNYSSCNDDSCEDLKKNLKQDLTTPDVSLISDSTIDCTLWAYGGFSVINPNKDDSNNEKKEITAYVRDCDIPVPKVYPLFKRRKERYFISTPEEVNELIEDYQKAVRDAPVEYCFHPGQAEKYMQYLQVPKDTGYRDFNDIWQRLVYQPSPFSEKSISNVEDSYALPINHEVWRRFKINPKNFVNWVSNLRIWIAQTLLHNIVEEIDTINNTLKTIVPGISIGNVGLDDLISTARNNVVTTSVPTLGMLLPYLQISTNQKYIVQRLRDLAVGNTMSDFAWKSGGKVDDKCWEPHLPCDSELIMHILITYFDSRMPISIEHPDRKPFSSVYFAKYPDTPPSSEIVIYQQHTSPPHYNLIIKNETCSIPPGAYNLFFSLLLFFHYIKTSHDGIVGRMYLGQSGVNILWTMEDMKV